MNSKFSPPAVAVDISSAIDEVLALIRTQSDKPDLTGMNFVLANNLYDLTTTYAPHLDENAAYWVEGRLLCGRWAMYNVLVEYGATISDEFFLELVFPSWQKLTEEG